MGLSDASGWRAHDRLRKTAIARKKPLYARVRELFIRFIRRKLIQEGGDLTLTHERWVTAAMKHHKSPDPGAIRNLGALAVVANP
jgi:hypothetical protein